MNHLLSLSQAARMVGVRRKTLQTMVQEGRLSVFEGSIRMSELLKEFPDASPEGSAMVDKMQRIRDAALFKIQHDSLTDAESLAAEAHRLRLDLRDAQAELAEYKALTVELQGRLYDMQEQCDKRQGLMLGALITWLAQRMSQRR